MKKISSFCAIGFFFLCCLTTTFLSGQVTTAVGGTIQHFGYDAIDLSNLRITLDIPLIAGNGPTVSDAIEISENFDLYVGTNGQFQGQLFLGYQNSSTWKYTTSTGGTFYWGTSTNVQCLSGTQYYQRSKQTNPYIVDSMGAHHPLPISWYYYVSPIGTCQNSGQYPYSGMTTDGSAIWGGPAMSAVDKSGFSGLGAIDPDGNDINAYHPGTSYATRSLNTFMYKDAAGTTQSVNVTVSPMHITSNWNCPGLLDEDQNPFNLPTSVTYANGTSLGISYEPGPSGGVTGRLQTLTLPTGGTITYTYTGGNAPGPGVGYICGSLGSGGGFTRTTAEGTWSYNTVNHSGPSNGGSVTTVTDPSGNNTIHTFQNLGLLASEVQVQVFQGGGVNCANGCTTSNLLLTKIYCYNNFNPANFPGDTGTVPTACANTDEPYPNGLAGKVPTEEDVYTAVPGVSGYAEVATSLPHGDPTSIKKYDFGASSPTEITTITYGSYANGTCQSVGTAAQNILNRKCEVTVSDGTHTISDTRYTYNSTGHPTTVSSWTGSAWLSASASYNPNGTVSTATSVDGVLSTYSYNGTGGCNSLLPTSVTTGGLTSYFTWDCNTGTLLTSTDPNNAVSTASYTANGADPLYRVKSRSGALGETVSYTYTDSSSTSSLESKMVFTAQSGTVVTHDALSYFDTLGRPYLNQVLDSSNYGTANTAWYWKPSGGTFNGITTLGKVIQKVAVPCNMTLGSTCPGTPPLNTSYFDAMGRLSTVLDAGGGTTSAQYIDNDVLLTLGPAPSGENPKSVQTEYDGLGRPKSVCQIQVSGGTSCGQANAKNGISTTFAYTMLSGATQVTATRGVQSHTKTYDALGRLLTWMTPERGTITYTYDVQSSTCGSHTYGGHLVEVADQAGNHTCYTFDATFGRLIQTSSVPSSTCIYYAYGDSAPTQPTGVTFVNGSNRIVAAYTSATCGGRTALTTDEWFSYDAEGNLTDVWESTPHSGGYYHTTAGYLLDGTLQSLTGIPGYTAISYDIDTVGRPITAKEGATNIVSGVSYNSALQPLTISIGNSGGDSSNYGYDPNTGRMSNWTFTVGSTPKSQTGTPTWSPNGTLRSLVINDGFNAGGSQNCYFGTSTTMGYDDFARLLSADCSPVWSQTFSYDQYDNLTKTGSSTWACTSCYNSSNNQYNNVLSASITYDANGRLTNDTFQKYQWNAYGQLTGTIAATGGNISCGATGFCYTYDALGQMVELSQGTTYYEMLYTPLGKTGRMSGQVTSSSYLPLPGGGTLYSTGTAGNNRYYQHKDWLGSIRVESQLGVRTVTYDRAFAPYGEMYDNFGVTTQLNFTGDTQDLDGASVLFDTPNRELHTSQGRWISPDPVSGGWNAYAYATDPNSEIDPTGLDPQQAPSMVCSSPPCTFTFDMTFSMNPNAKPVAQYWPLLTMPPLNGNSLSSGSQVQLELSGWQDAPSVARRMRVPFVVTGSWNKFKIAHSGRGTVPWEIPALNGIPNEIGNEVAGLFNLGNEVASFFSSSSHPSTVKPMPLIQPSSSGEKRLMAATSVALFFAGAAEEKAAVSVYSIVKDGEVVYVGITSNLARRAAEHGEVLTEIVGALTRNQARGVEQALIEHYGLAKNGGTLLNKINSIARSSGLYEPAVAFGQQLLHSIGYLP